MLRLLSIKLFLSACCVCTLVIIGFSQDIKGVKFQYQSINSLKYEGVLTLLVDPSLGIQRPYVLFDWSVLDTLYLINSVNYDSNLGKREYLGHFTFPGPGNYHLGYTGILRVEGISNIDSSQYEPIGLNAMLITNPFTNNNSPVIFNTQYDITYENGTYTFFPNVWDPENDSLHFELIECIGNNYYIPDNLYINPVDGTITFYPDTSGSYSICSQIEQWNNGEYKGNLTYDVLFEVDEYLGTNVRALNDMHITIYPNPTTGAFNISFDIGTPNDVNINIFNSLGQVIYSKSIQNVTGQTNVEITLDKHLSSGTYHIQLVSDNFVTSKPLIIIQDKD